MPEVSVACMCPCGVHSTKPVSHSRPITRFRTGCHGLQVDAGRWADGVSLDRTDRLCLMRKSFHCVEDEQHFVFDCLGPAYKPYQVTALGPPAALLYYCRLHDCV